MARTIVLSRDPRALPCRVASVASGPAGASIIYLEHGGALFRVLVDGAPLAPGDVVAFVPPPWVPRAAR